MSETMCLDLRFRLTAITCTYADLIGDIIETLAMLSVIVQDCNGV